MNISPMPMSRPIQFGKLHPCADARGKYVSMSTDELIQDIKEFDARTNGQERHPGIELLIDKLEATVQVLLNRAGDINPAVENYLEGTINSGIALLQTMQATLDAGSTNRLLSMVTRASLLPPSLLPK